MSWPKMCGHGTAQEGRTKPGSASHGTVQPLRISALQLLRFELEKFDNIASSAGLARPIPAIHPTTSGARDASRGVAVNARRASHAVTIASMSATWGQPPVRRR